MSDTETTPTRRSTTRSSTKSDDEAVELPLLDEAMKQGYLGVATDTAPNEHYTVAGVIARAEEGPPNVVVEADPEHVKPDK